MKRGKRSGGVEEGENAEARLVCVVQQKPFAPHLWPISPAVN